MIDCRERLRAALALCRRGPSPPRTSDLPRTAWAECQATAALLAEAERRRWPVAAAECRRRLGRQLDELRYQLDALRHALADRPAERPATAREIDDDLRALEREFAAVRVNLKQRELAVTTEPVTLAGVPLGPFQVVLEWSAERWDYRVAALEPNSPAGHEDVTHPHVRNDQLCEGEGQAAIRRALAAGRLFDFFSIVGRTLATYNAASAYVPLRRWHGVACQRCGDVSDEADSSSCQRCGDDLCDACGGCCSACGHWCCCDCAADCPTCGANVCGACCRRCDGCRETFCQECFDDDQRCPRCRPPVGGDDESDEPRAAPLAGAAADADGVGQARVSA